jgi:hypothetical protein
MKAGKSALTETLMGKGQAEAPLWWPAVCATVATALLLAGCTTDDDALRTATAKNGTPGALRYYGGPKYPMYPDQTGLQPHDGQ